jgi:tripartite-type tricarboxylate transporter receptor subunit TctC
LKRVAIAPELPTIDESGVKGFDVSSWFGFFYQAKVSKEIATKLHTDTVAALKHDSVKNRLVELGADPIGSTPDELARHLQAEMAKWGPLIAEAKIKIEN